MCIALVCVGVFDRDGDRGGDSSGVSGGGGTSRLRQGTSSTCGVEEALPAFFKLEEVAGQLAHGRESLARVSRVGLPFPGGIRCEPGFGLWSCIGRDDEVAASKRASSVARARDPLPYVAFGPKVVRCLCASASVQQEADGYAGRPFESSIIYV